MVADTLTCTQAFCSLINDGDSLLIEAPVYRSVPACEGPINAPA